MFALGASCIWTLLYVKPGSHNYIYFFNAAEWIIMVLNQFYLGSFYFDWEGVSYDL